MDARGGGEALHRAVRLSIGVLGIVALAASAAPSEAQWPQGKGNFWAKISYFRHQTTEQFRSNGDKRPFLVGNGESRSSAVFVDALVGVTDRLDVWAQVPYFDLAFDDDADDRRSTGVGDIRLSARYALFSLRSGSLRISGRFTAKIPVIDFPISAEQIPVGAGQWDYTAWIEAGLSLYPLPAYAVLWLGRRWRTLNEKTTRDPGDEFALLAEFGVMSIVGGLGGRVTLDGIFAETGSIQGIAVSSDEAEILYFAPGLMYQITSSTALEAAIRIPLRGKNFPAGSPLMIALYHTGSLWN